MNRNYRNQHNQTQSTQSTSISRNQYNRTSSKRVVLPSSNDQFRQYVFKKDQQHLLGKGSFAKVYRGSLIRQEPVAIKHIRLNKLEKHKDNLEQEIKIMKSLQHDNIVNLLDVVEADGHIFLIMEHCGGGDLKKYMNHRPMREKPLKMYMRQLMEGLKYLHERNIMHRDLKPHNLLLSADKKTLKISDFGFAKSMTSEESLAQTMCGTPYYMAPEIMMNKKYLSKADLWSVGIIMYEMSYGAYPFGDVNGPFELRDKIESVDIKYPSYPEETNNELSDDAIDLLIGLLQKDPGYRLSWEEFFTHTWLNPDMSPKPPTKLNDLDIEHNGQNGTSPQFSMSQSIPIPLGQDNGGTRNTQNVRNTRNTQNTRNTRNTQNIQSVSIPTMRNSSIFQIPVNKLQNPPDNIASSPNTMGGFTPTDLNSITLNSPFLSQAPQQFLNLVSNYRSTPNLNDDSSMLRQPSVNHSEPVLIKRHPQYDDEEEDPNESTIGQHVKDYFSASVRLAKDSFKSFSSLP